MIPSCCRAAPSWMKALPTIWCSRLKWFWYFCVWSVHTFSIFLTEVSMWLVKVVNTLTSWSLKQKKASEN